MSWQAKEARRGGCAFGGQRLGKVGILLALAQHRSAYYYDQAGGGGGAGGKAGDAGQPGTPPSTAAVLAVRAPLGPTAAAAAMPPVTA
jgi:hypothetical protein